MSPAKRGVLTAILLGQAALYYAGGRERPLPPVPPLHYFPAQLGEWRASGEIPIEPAVLGQLGADDVLHRFYTNEAGVTASVLVAYHRSQRGGRTQPHSPQVCLPGAGWLPESSERVRVGELEVKRYIVSKGRNRAEVMYWYQTPFRAVASEWWAKFWLIADAARFQRTDTTLVRIVAPVGGGGGLEELVRDLYAAMRRQLPR